jgi:hypothetical protein
LLGREVQADDRDVRQHAPAAREDAGRLEQHGRKIDWPCSHVTRLRLRQRLPAGDGVALHGRRCGVQRAHLGIELGDGERARPHARAVDAEDAALGYWHQAVGRVAPAAAKRAAGEAHAELAASGVSTLPLKGPEQLGHARRLRGHPTPD